MLRPTFLFSFAGLLSIALACGGAVQGTVTDGSSSTTDASTTESTDSTTTGTTTTASTEPTTSGATGTGTDSTTSTSTSPTTGTTTTDSGTTTSDGTTSTTGTTDTGTSSSGSSTTGGVSDDYPACAADEDCSEPYTMCWPPMDFGMPNFCTLPCAGPDECPVPATGTATPVCEGPPGNNVCILDCTEGECPDGMSCVDVFGNGQFMRCTRM